MVKNMDWKVLAGIVIIIVVGIFAIVNYQDGLIEEKQSKLDLLLERSQIELEKVGNSTEIHLYPEDQVKLFHMYAHYEDED